jgi:hypothetical protein
MPPSALLAGWRTMFLVLGVVTVGIGLCVLMFLPDTPMRARWLSDLEKVALLKHVSINQTGIQNHKFRGAEILEALTDPQLYLMICSVVLVCPFRLAPSVLLLTSLQLSISSGVVTTYSSTLIRNLGYAAEEAALMNMPSGVVSIVFTLVVGYGIRKQSNRWAWIILCIIPGSEQSLFPFKFDARRLTCYSV